MKNKTVVDIFAGCGGMSWGLQQCGYDVLLGIDNNPKYLQTFRRNFGEKRSLEIDIRLCEGKEILKMTNLERGELELLVGGPPCQGFSKNTPVRNRTLDSENNVLMREFLRLSREMFPQNIIMENVAEMKNGFGGEYTELIKTQLKELGYELIHHVFDASDYGIPQRRRRAFFLATRMGYSFVFKTSAAFTKATICSTICPGIELPVQGNFRKREKYSAKVSSYVFCDIFAS